MSDSVFACTLQRAYVAQEVAMEFAQISVRVLLLNQHLRGGAEGVGVGIWGGGVKRVTACYKQPAGSWPRLGNSRARLLFSLLLGRKPSTSVFPLLP